jgi:hypothetical protein
VQGSLGQGHRPDHSAIAFRPAAVIFTQNNFGGLPLALGSVPMDQVAAMK